MRGHATLIFTTTSQGQVSNSRGNSTGGSSPGGIITAVAINCTGTAAFNGNGLEAGSATNCTGTSNSGIGLKAINAQGCTGYSTSGVGLQTGTGINCAGSTQTGPHALYGNILTSCQGVAASGTGHGLQGFYAATNCLGISQGGTGLISQTATNCVGQTSTGPAAISTTIAVSCISDGGPINAANKYNMP